jgi:hypothetical protein
MKSGQTVLHDQDIEVKQTTDVASRCWGTCALTRALSQCRPAINSCSDSTRPPTAPAGY